MNGPRDLEACRVAERIMAYLHEHADAADTAEGIAEWWLTEAPRPTTRMISRAMEWLLSQGRIERKHLPDGTVVYRNVRATRER